VERLRLVDGVETTPLGYGCAGLAAQATQRESVRLLEVAHDAGIRHFDVARSYGYGEAERALGRFLAGRRDTVTVTTKLGLAPPPAAGALRVAKAVARRAVRLAPALRGPLRAGSGTLVRGGRFGVDEARASLETSLVELGTDHVDLLLLHDCEPADVSDDLVAFLQGVVATGQARAVGLATGREQTAAIARARPELAGLVQVADSVLLPHPAALAGPGAALITHSTVREAAPRLAQHLAAPGTAAAWAAQGGADLRDGAVLGRFLVAAALRRNARGVTLVGSRDERHLRADAEAVTAPPADAELDAFAALAAQLAAGSPAGAPA
jgi:aryl-alcohol dehydrogenase-like predicted oxidoreductase